MTSNSPNPFATKLHKRRQRKLSRAAPKHSDEDFKRRDRAYTLYPIVETLNDTEIITDRIADKLDFAIESARTEADWLRLEKALNSKDYKRDLFPIIGTLPSPRGSPRADAEAQSEAEEDNEAEEEDESANWLKKMDTSLFNSDKGPATQERDNRPKKSSPASAPKGSPATPATQPNRKRGAARKLNLEPVDNIEDTPYVDLEQGATEDATEQAILEQAAKIVKENKQLANYSETRCVSCKIRTKMPRDKRNLCSPCNRAMEERQIRALLSEKRREEKAREQAQVNILRRAEIIKARRQTRSQIDAMTSLTAYV